MVVVGQRVEVHILYFVMKHCSKWNRATTVAIYIVLKVAIRIYCKGKREIGNNNIFSEILSKCCYQKTISVNLRYNKFELDE